jgi:hypothetical protein
MQAACRFFVKSYEHDLLVCPLHCRQLWGENWIIKLLMMIYNS